MKKIILLLFCFLVSFTGLAQIAQPSRLDTVAIPIINPVGFYNYNFLYKTRLDSIQKIVPLSYNEYVQSFITIYSKQKDRMGKMLGLSNYYFPIFEKALATYQIPAEIKYLPIVESTMNPYAVSRVGATGLWQFMFGTAKAYGLNMDNFIDERKDPVQASYAAAAYFRDAYNELGDWLLAIAAYNCGKGAVTRAIDKAGSRDFWEIRQFLPKETRDYVPAFIATLYVMNFADRHDIPVQNSTLHQKTDTIQVNNFVSLTNLSKALDLDESVLLSLNPAYKQKIVNGTSAAPKRIVLPYVDQQKYVQLYEALNLNYSAAREVTLASTDDVRDLKKRINAKTKLKPAYFTYKVKAGDTLTSISQKFNGSTVASIKNANGLNKGPLQPGMLLKIVSL